MTCDLLSWLEMSSTEQQALLAEMANIETKIAKHHQPRHAYAARTTSTPAVAGAPSLLPPKHAMAGTSSQEKIA